MKTIEQMTLDEKIGQLLMCGFPADDMTRALKLIKEHKVGNIILFARNIRDGKQLFEQNQQLQRTALKELGVPLLISVDQEGGMVTRIFKGGTFFPGAMTVAATNNSDYAYQIGKHMGKELRLLGINMNLAPVLDVNNNPHNPVIGVRSYSDDPEKVQEYGNQFIKGLQEEGIFATGKHFPGHGDTSVDSHLDLSSVPHTKERLEQVELYPFKKAIEQNISAIMTAHVLFPAYEPDGLPATLSKRVLTELLRKELRFEGLIVTDSMTMKAIDTYFTTEKAAVMALEAGVNILIVSHAYDRQLGVIEAIKEAVHNGRLTEEMIDHAVKHVLQFKAQIEEEVHRFTERSYHEIIDQIDTIEHRSFSQKIANDALTLVKGERFTKPERQTLFIAPHPQVTTIADEALDNHSILTAVKEHFPNWQIEALPINPTEGERNHLIELAKKYQQVVVCSYNANIYEEQKKLLNKLQQKVSNLHVIALRNPYDLMGLDVNGVCVYEYTPLTIQTIIHYLKGELTPRGQLPISLD